MSFSFRSIQTKGLALSFLIIVLTSTILGWTAYRQFRHILVRDTYDVVESMAIQGAQHFSHYLEAHFRPIRALASDRAVTSGNLQRQVDVLHADALEAFSAVAIVDPAGIAHYRDGMLLDLSDRKYIEQVLTGKEVFSEIIISRMTGEPAIMMAVPIFSDTRQPSSTLAARDVWQESLAAPKVIGAVIARLDADVFRLFVESPGYGEDSQVFVVNEDGSYLAHRDRDVLWGQGTIYDPQNGLSDEPPTAEFVGLFSEAVGEMSGSGTYFQGNEDVMLGYSRIDDTEWFFFVGVPTSSALAGLRDLDRLFLIGLAVALVLSFLASSILTKQFVKPILRLEQLFARGAGGDLSIRFTHPPNDEIGRAGASFNRMMDTIRSLMYYDPLTGLPNQKVLEERLLSLTESDREVDMVMLSIDDFRLVNETYGYATGDETLNQLATMVKSRIPKGWDLFRYRGDEFVLFTDEQRLPWNKEGKLPEQLKSWNQVIVNGIPLRLSIGILPAPWPTKDPDEILMLLTNAKNHAKLMGGGQLQVYDESLHQGTRKLLNLQMDIPAGLAEDQFHLLYQPIMNLEHQTVQGYEALVRWQHPLQGAVYPDTFIPLAEQSGSIISLDQWVIDRACQQLAEWRAIGLPPWKVSVNIAAPTFESEGFAEFLEDTLHRYSIDPNQFQLEITERMVIADLAGSIAKLQQLRDFGVQIAIDDFGIGYSSLAYLVRLPVDVVKIDGSFVQSIQSSAESRIIVEAILGLCRQLRLTAVAEGIETEADLKFIQDSGCYLGQGYFFARPIPADEIAPFLEAQQRRTRSNGSRQF